LNKTLLNLNGGRWRDVAIHLLSLNNIMFQVNDKLTTCVTHSSFNHVLSFRISSLRIELDQFRRKYDLLMETEGQHRIAKSKLSDEMLSMKILKDQEIIQLRKMNVR